MQSLLDCRTDGFNLHSTSQLARREAVLQSQKSGKSLYTAKHFIFITISYTKPYKDLCPVLCVTDVDLQLQKVEVDKRSY